MVKEIGLIKRSRKITLLITVGILLLVAGAGYKGYVWYAVRADKQRFTEASVLVDKIYADIVTELGQPEDSKRTNSCSRPYREFTGYGDPTCSVSVRVIYDDATLPSANEGLEKLQGIISNQSRFTNKHELTKKISNEQVGNNLVYGAFDEYSYNRLTCSAKYLYDSPSETGLKLTNKATKSFYIAFVCSDKARSLIYPAIQ